jgi:hypothetical protein
MGAGICGVVGGEMRGRDAMIMGDAVVVVSVMGVSGGEGMRDRLGDRGCMIRRGREGVGNRSAF